ncbi:MAG: hypothetical protein AAB613_02035 [Patescibacteria group bacterium]
MMEIKQIIGWYGVIVILAAYALNSFGIISAEGGVLYQFLNLTGSLGIVISSFAQRDYQPVVLNAIWLIIALIGLARIWF